MQYFSQAAPRVKRKKTTSKYGNHIVIVGEQKFDSKVEYRYYRHLEQLQAIGEIQSFERQKAFLLEESFEKNGRTYKPIMYVADFFVTYADGEQVVIDVKGQDKVTTDFAMKFKMFHKRYPYRFIIARAKPKSTKFRETETLH